MYAGYLEAKWQPAAKIHCVPEPRGRLIYIYIYKKKKDSIVNEIPTRVRHGICTIGSRLVEIEYSFQPGFKMKSYRLQIFETC